MIIGIDLDGTIDSFPILFQSLMSGFKASGNTVYVITGAEGPTVSDDERAAKQQYLTGLGITAYDELIVCPEPHDVNKAKVIQDKHVSLLIDNRADNAEAAKGYCAVLILWNNLKNKTPVPVHDRAHGHSHEVREDGVELCCNGQTAADHRAGSASGKCCVDPVEAVCPDGVRRTVTFDGDGVASVLTPHGVPVTGTLTGELFRPHVHSHKMWYAR